MIVIESVSCCDVLIMFNKVVLVKWPGILLLVPLINLVPSLLLVLISALVVFWLLLLLLLKIYVCAEALETLVTELHVKMVGRGKLIWNRSAELGFCRFFYWRYRYSVDAEYRYHRLKKSTESQFCRTAVPWKRYLSTIFFKVSLHILFGMTF